MGQPESGKPGNQIIVPGTGSVAKISQGPTVIGKDILPDGVRNVQDLTGLVHKSIIDIIGKGSSISKPLSEVIDVETRFIPDEPLKIGN